MKSATFIACVALLLLLVNANRIVVIGDLHGDLEQGLALLRSTKVVSFQPNWYKDQVVANAKKSVASGNHVDLNRDEVNANMIYNKRGNLMAGSNPDSYHWSAGKGILVVTGDAMNVGPDDIDIIRLFMRLDKEAVAAGGKMVYTFGNHEIHNLESDFTGVHPWSFERSGGREGRTRLLSMQNPLGRFLRTRPALFEFDGLIFMHGGLFPKSVETIKKVLKPYHRETMVEEINKAVTKALTSKKGRDTSDPVSELILDADYNTNGDKGPLLVHPLTECEKVREANKMLGEIQAQVVGHTPHDPPKYDFCNGALYAVDFKMSQWKGGEGAAFAGLEFTRQENKDFVFSNKSTGHLPRWKWEAKLVIPSEEDRKQEKECTGYTTGVVAGVALGAVILVELILMYFRRGRKDEQAGSTAEKAPINEKNEGYGAA